MPLELCRGAIFSKMVLTQATVAVKLGLGMIPSQDQCWSTTNLPEHLLVLQQMCSDSRRSLTGSEISGFFLVMQHCPDGMCDPCLEMMESNWSLLNNQTRAL